MFVVEAEHDAALGRGLDWEEPDPFAPIAGPGVGLQSERLHERVAKRHQPAGPRRRPGQHRSRGVRGVQSGGHGHAIGVDEVRAGKNLADVGCRLDGDDLGHGVDFLGRPGRNFHDTLHACEGARDQLSDSPVESVPC